MYFLIVIKFFRQIKPEICHTKNLNKQWKRELTLQK